MSDLDRYRFEPGEAMASARAAQAHPDSERQRVIDLWRRIDYELDHDGPISQLLWGFRGQAVEAMSQLIYAETSDPNIMRLQNDVRRSLETMEHIGDFKSAAEAVGANETSELDDEDPPLIHDGNDQ